MQYLVAGAVIAIVSAAVGFFAGRMSVGAPMPDVSLSRTLDGYLPTQEELEGYASQGE
jgi:hypothetical protein